MKNALEWIQEKIFPEPKDEDLFPPTPNLDELPGPYTDRFSLNPAREPSEVLGRAGDEVENGKGGELKVIENALEQWKNHGIPLLLEGESGVGMTSLLQAAMPLLPEPVVFLEDKGRITCREELLPVLTQAMGAEKAESLDALAHVEPGAPRVVVFENVERLFLRRIGGYDLLQDFLLFVNATRKKVFWVVTINDYSFYFLNHAIKLADNFSSKKVSCLSADKIKAAIMKRNEGFRMMFLKPEKLSRRYKQRLSKMDPESRQASLRENFFGQLLEFAGGNISRAIIYWLAAARGVKEGIVHLKAPAIVKPQEVPLEELLVLEAVFLHTSLSFEEVEAVFHHSSYNGRLLLDRLLSRGWLYPRSPRSGVQEYQVNFWFLHELKELLKNKLNRKIS
ncbi:MAG: ATP-binding protein [Phaeodactylibacter sp.]|nr:ATP-binding protein [Phaeodactylibacter sp.]MCB9263484.1 ATP-binding protein [Lewinellaceae bacterium]MCB9291424.1 ATP-binding protein [Lewinellaceae bacterium]